MSFYDALAPYYHLIYPDWEASLQRQGRALATLIRSYGGEHLLSVLDAACGIGTQSLGLAELGYMVTASDLSPAAVERASCEAKTRGIPLHTSVADMRHVHEHHQRTFDVVLACDNSIPHLLTDEEILGVLQQFYRCTAAEGICLVSVRDYAALPLEGVQLHPYGVRQEGTTRYVLFQVWECAPPLYETTLYVVEHPHGTEPRTHSMRSTYYAVSITTLMRLMQQAGFSDVQRFDRPFFQPVVAGRRSAPA